MELNDKKKLIENEKTTLELSGGVGPIMPMEVKPTVTRKLRRRPNDPPPVTEKKRKTNATPLHLLLGEDQILADLKKIGKYHKPAQPTEEKNPKTTKTTGKINFHELSWYSCLSITRTLTGLRKNLQPIGNRSTR